MLLPGVLAGLANTDVGAVVTYTASGARYGLASLKVQLFCIPLMYSFQEFGARIGATTNKGVVQLTREVYGARAAWTAAVGLLVLCLSTLFCEAAGAAAIADLLHVWRSVPVLVSNIVLGSLVSPIGEYVALGLASLLSMFVVFAAMAWTSTGDALALDVANADFDVLVVSATIGTALTPFLFFYTCHASLGLAPTDLPRLRLNLAVGVGCAVLAAVGITISAAFEFWHTSRSFRVRSVQDCGDAFAGALGRYGTLVFVGGLAGASLTASFCTLSTVLWVFDELRDDVVVVLKPDLREDELALIEKSDALAATPARRPFPAIAVCVGMLLISDVAVLVLTDHKQMTLEIAAQDLSSLSLPPALALGIALARAVLDDDTYPPWEHTTHIFGASLLSFVAVAPIVYSFLVSLHSSSSSLLVVMWFV